MGTYSVPKVSKEKPFAWPKFFLAPFVLPTNGFTGLLMSGPYSYSLAHKCMSKSCYKCLPGLMAAVALPTSSSPKEIASAQVTEPLCSHMASSASAAERAAVSCLGHRPNQRESLLDS